MELALPHVVVRVCGPGVGPDLSAALSVHPVEVSEARDKWEMQRVSNERPALLVVVVDPPDARAAVVETRADFPGVPILVVSDSAESFVPGDAATGDCVDTIRSSQPVPDICWHVIEAVGRSARLPGATEHSLGPDLIEVDERGIISLVDKGPCQVIDGGFHVRPGDAMLSVVEPLERSTVTHVLERAHAGETQFCAVRILDEHGRRHPVALAVRRVGAGRVAVLIQPLIFGGPIVGRKVNDREPITGLLTRWALSRALEDRARQRPRGASSALVLLTLDEFTAISNYIGHERTDAVLLSVASTLNEIFPYPALASRLLGDGFLTLIPEGGSDEAARRAERLLTLLNGIAVPGFTPRFMLRASIGVAAITNGDPDLAVRLAEAAAAEAHAAGGNRVVVAKSAQFTGAQTRDLTASLDRGSWELWLQPVLGDRHGRAEFHEALARFSVGQRQLASRADLFVAGQAEGLLERFDRMMLQRALEILAAHPDVRLSVNVTYESFVSKTFPDAFLQLIQQVPEGRRRIILEISPRCMASPNDVVRPRLESLATAGVAVALDDFGSGICRLRYLTQWPLAFVKLDESVTRYVDDDPLQRDFVRTVVSLCRARGITTVAEYVRSEEQLARLVEDGVDLFQGELFGMPRPATEMLSLSAVETAHA